MLSCRGKERPVADPATKKLEMILLAEDSIRLLEQRVSVLAMEIMQDKTRWRSRSDSLPGAASVGAVGLKEHLEKLERERERCLLRLEALKKELQTLK